jgi:hypothetical protein
MGRSRTRAVLEALTAFVERASKPTASDAKLGALPAIADCLRQSWQYSGASTLDRMLQPPIGASSNKEE